MHLYFESLKVLHAGLIYPYMLDDDLYHFIPDKPYAELESLKQCISVLVNGSGKREEIWKNWIIFRDQDQDQVQPAGTLQATIVSQTKTAYVGYVIFKDFWNKGYATQALIWPETHLNQQYAIYNLEAYVDTKTMHPDVY